MTALLARNIQGHSIVRWNHLRAALVWATRTLIPQDEHAKALLQAVPSLAVRRNVPQRILNKTFSTMDAWVEERPSLKSPMDRLRYWILATLATGLRPG